MRRAAWTLALLVFAPRAQAEELGTNVRAHFAWVAPPGCVKEPTLEKSVEELLKRPVFVAEADADVTIEGRAEPRDAGGWTGTLTMRARDGRALGTRSLVSESADCRALEGPLAVVLALLVDLERREVVLELPVPESPPPAPAPAAAPPAPAPLPPTEPRGPSGAIALGARAAWGFLPAVDEALVLRGEVDLDADYGGAFDLGLWRPERADDSGPSGEFSAWLFGLALCRALARSEAVHAGLCLGVSAGSITGYGIALSEAATERRNYLEATTRAEGALRVAGPLEIGAELGLGVPFTRPRFYYALADGTPVTVHRVAAVVPQGGIFLRVPLSN
jgi:hypothetical protein